MFAPKIDGKKPSSGLEFYVQRSRFYLRENLIFCWELLYPFKTTS
jgi:hypothetical protein